MRFDDPFSEEDRARAATVSATSRMEACASLEGVRALFAFREVYLKTLTPREVLATDLGQALLGIHYRMVAFMLSLLHTATPTSFQTHAAIARTVFELGVDLELVLIEKEVGDRLRAFKRVDEFKIAERTVTFYANKKNGTARGLDLSKERALRDRPNEREEVDALIRKYWAADPKETTTKTDYPTHWTRSDLGGRVGRLHRKWKGRHVSEYARLSSHVHAGLANVMDLDEKDFELISARAYTFITEIVLDSYRTLAQECGWVTLMPEWNQRFEFLSKVKELSLIHQKLHSLDGVDRFDFLDASEVEQFVHF